MVGIRTLVRSEPDWWTGTGDETTTERRRYGVENPTCNGGKNETSGGYLGV